MSKIPKAIMSLDLAMPVLGRKIIAASEKIASESYRERFYRDDRILYMVGQKSKYPYANLKILVDNKEELIDPIKSYHVGIKIISCEWPTEGIRYAIGYDDSDFADAASDFRDKLREELMKTK